MLELNQTFENGISIDTKIQLNKTFENGIHSQIFKRLLKSRNFK